ncbi:MAG: acyltransferase [Parasphingorhabdus sp.]
MAPNRQESIQCGAKDRYDREQGLMETLRQQSKPDLRALTGLRGIAAWFVVLYHIRVGMSGFLPEPIMSFLAKGYLAVDFFFLLSGFVMWLSYSERFKSSGYGYFLPFYWRRIARIWPLHLAIMVGTIAFVLLLITTDRTTMGYPLNELPLQILLLQNWGFTSELAWNHPAWSISTEMAAYLVFPILAVTIRWNNFSSSVLLGLVGLIALLIHAYFFQRGHVTLGSDIPQTGLFRCVMQFIIGTILCVLWKRWRENWVIAGYFGAAGITLIAGFVLSGDYETLLVPVAFSCLVLASAILAEAGNNPLACRALHYLGETSYATYLTHFMLFIWFKIIFVDDPQNISPLLVTLFLGVTFLTSAILYHWVEKPGQKLFLQPSQNKHKVVTAD